jgi:hypothetical protein
MAPTGLLRPREVPAGWGLLEADPRALNRGWSATAGAMLPCSLRVPAVALASPQHRRVRLLRNLAVAAARGVGYATGADEPRRAPKRTTHVTEQSLFAHEKPPQADTIASVSLPR